jgi:hypothetical protein
MPGSKQLPLSSEQSDLQLVRPKSTYWLSTAGITAGLDGLVVEVASVEVSVNFKKNVVTQIRGII